jgi:hypothetical protein
MNPYERADFRTDAIRAQTPGAETKNAALAYGVLGAALGAALGLAGGLARRSFGGGLLAAIVGVVAGVAAGAGMSAVMAPAFYRLHDPIPSSFQTFLPFLTHGGIWVAIGVAGGLALALGVGQPKQIVSGLIGGLLGAMLGTVVFEATNSIAFPLVPVENPVPSERLPRLVSHFSVAIFTALGAALALRPGREKA